MNGSEAAWLKIAVLSPKMGGEADMRKVLIGALSLLLLGVDWAALHDILKGERDVWLEWAFLIASALLLAVSLARRLRRAN